MRTRSSEPPETNARGRLNTAVAALLAILVLEGTPGSPAAEEQEGKPDLLVRAGRLHIGDGRVIENGVVAVREGTIVSVGKEVPDATGLPVVNVPAGSVTPGLIDANARLEPLDILPSSRRTAREVLLDLFSVEETATASRSSSSGSAEVTLEAEATCQHEGLGGPVCPHCGGPGDSAQRRIPFAAGVRSVALSEQSSEVVPHTRVLDTLDFSSPDFQRLARGGVTTVYASPDSSAVIGPRGAILKTAGRSDRRLLSAAAAVKAVMGSDPARVGSYNRPARFYSVTMYTRRPTTRMGTTWVFRKAFYDTLARDKGLPVGGADTPVEQASAVLSQVLQKEIPLRVQARTLPDITAAVRLCREFKIPFTLEEGTEAHRCLDLLRSYSVPVVYGPIEMRPRGLRRFTNETQDARLYTLRALIESGVTTALSAQDLREEDGLARQAMYAVRFGVSLDEAVKAVTSTPARLLGIDQHVGTLEVGKHADLVVWSGPPFAATSMPVVVVVGGQVVVDRRG